MPKIVKKKQEYIVIRITRKLHTKIAREAKKNLRTILGEIESRFV